MSKGKKAVGAQVGLLIAIGTSSSAAVAGDGWYLSANAGATFAESQNFKIDFANETLINRDGHFAKVELDDGWIGGLGGGYAFSSGLRTELVFDRRRNDLDSLVQPPAGLFGNQGGAATNVHGREIVNSAMANLWFDLFKSSWIHPYIGGGAGYAQLSLRDAGYNNVGFLSKHDGVLAYQYGGGLTVDIGANWAVSLDYRRFETDKGKFDLLGDSGSASKFKFRYQADEALLSVRYYFDGKPEAKHEETPQAEEPVNVVEPIASDVPEEAAPAPVSETTAACEAPKPGQRISLDGCKVGDTLVLRGVTFEFNKATLTPDARSILDEVADELNARGDIKVEVDGHTDSRGSDSYNQQLSEGRADAVKAYLAERGIDPSRMTSQGFGETQPIADNETDEGRELNRRVELKVIDAGDGQPAEAAASEAAVEPEPAAEEATAEQPAE